MIVYAVVVVVWAVFGWNDSEAERRTVSALVLCVVWGLGKSVLLSPGVSDGMLADSRIERAFVVCVVVVGDGL